MDSKTCIVHTLRVYDKERIEKLDRLMKKIGYKYKDNNAFFTELVMLGYEKYLELSPMPDFTLDTATLPDGLKELYPLLLELSQYSTEQFKNLYINQKVTHKLLSAVYHIVLGLSKEEKVLPDKADEGMHDDLPARFEEIILTLKARYGVK